MMKRGGGGEAKFSPPKDNIRFHGGEIFGAGRVQRFNHQQRYFTGMRFFLLESALSNLSKKTYHPIDVLQI
jgi:hypothetical protein